MHSGSQSTEDEDRNPKNFKNVSDAKCPKPFRYGLIVLSGLLCNAYKAEGNTVDDLVAFLRRAKPIVVSYTNFFEFSVLTHLQDLIDASEEAFEKSFMSFPPTSAYTFYANIQAGVRALEEHEEEDASEEFTPPPKCELEKLWTLYTTKCAPLPLYLTLQTYRSPHSLLQTSSISSKS
jgi:hypothetical protein